MKSVLANKFAAVAKGSGASSISSNNKYSELSQEQMLHICKLINPTAEWKFFQYLDNDGKGGDDCYEFLSDDESCIQFNIHQSQDDEIRCYLKGDWENDEVPENKIEVINNYLESL